MNTNNNNTSANENKVMDTQKLITCCICGKSIPFRESCNPDPFVTDEGARCCHRCDEGYVIPSREDPSVMEFLHKEAEFCYGKHSNDIIEDEDGNDMIDDEQELDDDEQELDERLGEQGFSLVKMLHFGYVSYSIADENNVIVTGDTMMDFDDVVRWIEE